LMVSLVVPSNRMDRLIANLILELEANK
jgi:hypothetical protein